MPYCLVLQLLSFFLRQCCFIPKSTQDAPSPYQVVSSSPFCCHSVSGSSINPEAELVLQSGLVEVPGPRAVRQLCLSCSSPLPSSCFSQVSFSHWTELQELQKKRSLEAPLWKQPSGKQGEGKGQVMSVLQTSWLWNLTASPLFLPSQQNWLQRGWEYFQNRPQSLGGVRATRTKAHRRPWQQRSTQYLSVVKWCLFRVTKRQGACSRRNEKKFGKKGSTSVPEMCARRQQEMQKPSFSPLALFVYSLSHTAGNLMRKKTSTLFCKAFFFFFFKNRRNSPRCHHYSNLWTPKWTSSCFENEGSLQFSDWETFWNANLFDKILVKSTARARELIEPICNCLIVNTRLILCS